MYLQYYGMTHNPFYKGTKERDVFITKDFKEMSSRLDYLEQQKGIGVFTAAPGFGKTFALRCFHHKLNPNLTKVLYLCLTTVTPIEFYRQLCFLLGMEPCFRKSDMFRSIKEHMEHMMKDKRIHYMLVLDEAQYLSNAILKDLKMLMNFEMDSKDCFSLVMIGQPVLANILEKQVHEALRQRIVINYEFVGMSEIEANEYVKQMLTCASASPVLFHDNAILSAFNSSAGSVRKFNHILTSALIIGASNEKVNIDTDIILAATNEISLI